MFHLETCFPQSQSLIFPHQLGASAVPRRLGRLYWANAPPSVTSFPRLHRLRALGGLPKGGHSP